MDSNERNAQADLLDFIAITDYLESQNPRKGVIPQKK